MSPNFLVYINNKKTGTISIIKNTNPNVVEIVQILPPTQEYHRFETFKGYDNSESGLKQFYNDLISWNDDLKSNPIFKMNWLSAYNNGCNVKFFFDKTSKTKLHDAIDKTESEWINLCYNSGIIYKKIGEYKKCKTYDFSFNYPKILASKKFIFPNSKGKEITLKKIPVDVNNIQIGIFRVKITCENDNFRKIFSFSKNNVYTSTSLIFAIKHKKEFNVNIELIIDDKPNCYQYQKNTRVTGESVFGEWFDKIKQLRALFPKNKLIKHLGSSLWGQLTKCLKMNVEEYKIDEYVDRLNDGSLEIVDKVTLPNEKSYYILTNKSCGNYRIKHFLTAYARNKTAFLAFLDLDSVVRIQIDSVTFSKSVDISDYDDLKLENDLCGQLKINSNNVEKYCKIEKKYILIKGKASNNIIED